MTNRLARRVHCVSLLCLSVLFAFASHVNGQTSAGVAPTLIPISGTLVTADGLPRAGSVLLVVSLYDTKEDTAPRWIEHRRLQRMRRAITRSSSVPLGRKGYPPTCSPEVAFLNGLVSRSKASPSSHE